MSGKEIIKGLLRAGTLIAAGAIGTAVVKDHDLSGIKGMAKVFIPLGIVGIGHAVGNAAADAIEKDVDNVFELVDIIANSKGDEEEKEEQVAVAT